jgi:hypothetical protein
MHCLSPLTLLCPNVHPSRLQLGPMVTSRLVFMCMSVLSIFRDAWLSWPGVSACVKMKQCLVTATTPKSTTPTSARCLQAHAHAHIPTSADNQTSRRIFALCRTLNFHDMIYIYTLHASADYIRGPALIMTVTQAGSHRPAQNTPPPRQLSPSMPAKDGEEVSVCVLGYFFL